MMNEDYLGAFVYFVEEGTLVDGQTVSSTIKPDVDPPSNFPQIGDIQQWGFGHEKISDPWWRYLPGGGSIKQQRDFEAGDYFDFTTRQMNELVYRLMTGVRSKIVTGEAQTPHVPGQDRCIRGWLRIQARALGGLDRFLLDWWCELRLAADPKFEHKVSQPALRAYNLAPIAGHSIVFPA